MGSPFGGGAGVTVNIGGSAIQLQTAAQQGATALNQFGQAAQQAGNTAGSAMRQAAQQFDQLTQAVKYLQQAQQTLGASQAQGDAAFLNSASSAQDYGDRLKLLQSYLGMVQAQQNQVKDSGEQTGASLNTNLFGRVTGWLFSFNQLIDAARNFGSVLREMGSVASTVFNAVTLGLPGMLQNGLGMLQQYGGQAMSMLEGYGIPLGPQGIAASFQLNQTTERLKTGWGYLFGGGGKVVNGQVVDPSGTAQSLMQWSSQESMHVPFTRQDMMSAMTSLGLVPQDKAGKHLSASQIEHYLPVLSDIASTYGSAAYGGQGVTLTQAAQALRMASEGSARMLKWDLNINPEELLQYGLKATGSGVGLHIEDPSTLLPALEGFAKAHGVYGASDTMAHGTFFGAFSSFVDRLQNFGLEVGGTQLNGDIRQGSLFANVKQNLNDISGWMDQHATDVAKLADTVQPLLGAGVSIGSGVLGGVFQGLQQGGAGQQLLDGLKGLGDLLHSKETRESLNQIGVTFGQVLGPAMKDVGMGSEALFGGIQRSGIGVWFGQVFQQMGQWLADPGTQKGMQQLGSTLGTLAGGVLTTAGEAVRGIVQGLTQTGVGQTLLTDLQNIGTWFADPQHQQQIESFFEQVGFAAGNLVNTVSGLLDKLTQLAGWVAQQVQNIQDPGNSNQMKQLITTRIQGESDEDAWNDFIKNIPNAQLKPGAKAYDVNMAALKAYFEKVGKENKLSAIDIQQLINRFLLDKDLGMNPDAIKANIDELLQQLEQYEQNGGAKMKPPATTAQARQAAMVAVLNASSRNAKLQALDTYQDGALAAGSAATIGLPTSASLTKQGQDAGAAYLAGFQTAFGQTPAAKNAVDAYVAAFNSKLTSAGDPLARSIATYVDQEIKAQIAAALNSYAPDVNGAGSNYKAPGGYRATIGVGMRLGGW